MAHRTKQVVLAALLLGVLSSHSVQAATASRTSAFEYDPITGFLTKEIIEPDSPQIRVETTYTYDQWGNKKQAVTSSPATGITAVSPRTSMSTYDELGQFAISSTNSAGHIESRTFDPKFGNITKVTSPNLIETRWEYDAFGRKKLEIRADQTRTKWDYEYCNGTNNGVAVCPSNAIYLITRTPLASDGITQNGSWVKSYFDSLDREIRSEIQGFDGTATITKDTEYDQYSRVKRVSKPYYRGQSIYWTVFDYDALGRQIAIYHPDDTLDRFEYSGLTTRSIDTWGNQKIYEKNSLGQLVNSTEAGVVLQLKYDPFGNVSETLDPNGNMVKMVYDQRGRKIQMVDPDMGTWNYEYNAFGELIRQTDAKNQVTTYAYDALGRMTQRNEADLISAWTYDTCTKGIGKSCTSSSDNGYLRTYSYDSLGRTSSTTTTVDTSYTISATYDANGRVATQTYPTGLAVKYVYTNLGYLKEVRDNQTNALFWAANVMDAEGHLLQQTHGNGIVTQHVYDSYTGRIKNIYAGPGNNVQNLTFAYNDLDQMTSRQDANQNLIETFEHDGVGRITSSTVNSGGAGVVTVNYDYDGLGDLTRRSDVGSYNYGWMVRPHTVEKLFLNNGHTRHYSYDDNGNLIGERQYDAANIEVTAKARSFAYTSFNMAKTLTAGSMALQFIYGPEHQRIKQIAPSGTTIYLHPDNQGALAYEKEIKTNGTVEHRHFVSAIGEVIALVKQVNGTTAVQYFHRDHLGSTTAITNADGTVAERFAYEPFGKRRFLQGMKDENGTIIGQHTDRGYTNHEHLDELGLIHMNGRIYDPEISRFMTPDPYIQEPENMQSYNRYSYVMNNPLGYTDPSGYFLDKVIKKIKKSLGIKNPIETHKSFHNAVQNHVDAIVDSITNPSTASAFKVMQSFPGRKAVDRVIANNETLYSVGQIAVSAAATFFCGGNWQCGAGAASLWSGYYTYYSTGSMNAAAKAGAISYGTAAAFSWAAGQGTATSPERYIAHAAVGCGSAVASGGECARGAAAAIAGKFVTNATGDWVKGPNDYGGMIAQGTAAAVAGGTASVIGGGKFENGAVTAAFGYLFNQVSSSNLCFTGQGCFATAQLQILETVNRAASWLASMVNGPANYGSMVTGYAATVAPPPYNVEFAVVSVALKAVSYATAPPSIQEANYDMIAIGVNTAASFTPGVWNLPVQITTNVATDTLQRPIVKQWNKN